MPLYRPSVRKPVGQVPCLSIISRAFVPATQYLPDVAYPDSFPLSVLQHFRRERSMSRTAVTVGAITLSGPGSLLSLAFGTDRQAPYSVGSGSI